jgi:hypothetical protein
MIGLVVGIAFIVLFASIFTSSSPFIIGHPSTGDIEGKTYCPSSRFQLSNVLIQDENGNNLDNTSVGSTVRLSAIIHSNCEIPNYLVAAGFLATKKDIPSLVTISRENVTLSKGQDIILQATWKPEKSGAYLVAVDAAACFRCSSDYGVYQLANFTVNTGDSNNSSQIACQQSGLCAYYLEEGDTIYSINYRFNGTIQNMTFLNPTQTLTITLNAPSDGNLEIAVPRELVNPTAGSMDVDFAVFADNINVDSTEYSTKDTKWAEALGVADRPDDFRIIAIQISAGTKTVEIVGTWLI